MFTGTWPHYWVWDSNGRLCIGLTDSKRRYVTPVVEGKTTTHRDMVSSSDRRKDCNQVCIALVVTREGIPLGYEVFPGNQAGVTTVKKIVRAMEARYGKADKIWVMDRGKVSEANLAWLRKEERQYLVGAPRSALKGLAAELLTERGWKEIRPGVTVKLCDGPGDGESFVLCRSEDRRSKEAAVHERFSRRIEERLTKLDARLKRVGKAADRDKVAVQVGRILGLNPRAAGMYKVRIKVDANRGTGLSVSFKTKPESAEWTTATEGVYALRTSPDVSGWTAEDLWATYMQLTDAESAFRTHKSDIALRPDWHQKADRVRAHILVASLAYVPWKTLDSGRSDRDWGRSPGSSCRRSVGFRAPMWCCRRRAAGNSGSAVWCSQNRCRRSSWTTPA